MGADIVELVVLAVSTLCTILVGEKIVNNKFAVFLFGEISSYVDRGLDPVSEIKKDPLTIYFASKLVGQLMGLFLVYLGITWVVSSSFLFAIVSVLITSIGLIAYSLKMQDTKRE